MKRACARCGKIVPATSRYCTDCQPQRGRTSERGYDGQHKRTRAELLPAAIGTNCPLCGEPMLASQQLHLDHSTPLADDPTSRGDRIVHATCNLSRGAGRAIFKDPHRPAMGIPREKARSQVIFA